jgi:translocation and assembly module TamB
LVSGTIDITRWDIRVPERLARPLTPIPVTHTNTAPGFIVTGEATDTTPDSAFTFGLDLAVRAPREVFVRGQGIDAEFGGDATLTGTIDDPAVRGRFDLRRGSITLLSQRVTLSRGSIQFLGDLEPVLDIAGGVTKNSVTASVTVKGKASDPQISLSSVPSLPQDEILARLLFSKQTSQLSPFEAAELAQAVGKWSGLTSGPDILDRLRTAIGIDALSATTDETGATAVNAGRYVGSGVFVGVSQASGGSATVDVDLSEDIKLRGEAGARGTKVGVAAEWEY